MNGCQRMPWSEEINGKELHGAFGGECDLDPTRSTFFLDIVNMVNTTFNIYYKYGVMLILKGWCSPCTTVMVQ